MAERLAEQYRVFACDLRNHGDSPRAPTMCFAEMADDLEALIEEKGLAPAMVLGHSVGGKTAMLTALAPPRRGRCADRRRHRAGRLRGAVPRVHRGDAGADLGPGRKRGEVDAALAAAVPDAATRLFLLQNLEERPAGGFAWRLNLEAIAANMPALLDFPDVRANSPTTAGRCSSAARARTTSAAPTTARSGTASRRRSSR